MCDDFDDFNEEIFEYYNGESDGLDDEYPDENQSDLPDDMYQEVFFVGSIAGQAFEEKADVARRNKKKRQ